LEILQPNKVFLDASSANKSVEDADTPSLVVGPTGACATKRLLSDYRTSALFVVIDVAGRVTQLVSCRQEGVTIRSETITFYLQIQQEMKNASKRKTTDMDPVRAYSVVLSISSRVFSKSWSSNTNT